MPSRPFKECPYCEQQLPKNFEPPGLDDPGQQPRRPKMKPEETRFYIALAEALDSFHGFVTLPPPTRWKRWTGLFHLCRAHHALNPERRSDEGWLCVVDLQAEYLMTLPTGYHIEGLPSQQGMRETIKELQKKINRMAREAEAEFGKIAVKRQQGRIYIRHEGPVPELPSRKEWAERIERLSP